MPNTPTPAIETKFAMPDPNQAPLNLVQLFTLANALISSTIQGDYLSYMIQHAEPGASDRDKVWIVTDTQGRPTDIKIWWNTSGSWRRVYNGMLGEIRGFSGDPSTYFNADGLGVLGGAYDGWHICNGEDGTPDLSNQFLCGANMNDEGDPKPGYDDGWQTVIDGIAYKGGGQWTEKLEEKHIPLPVLRVTPMSLYDVTGLTADPDGFAFGRKTDTSQYFLPGYPEKNYTYPPEGYKGNDEDGNPNPEALFTGPPFYSLAWIIFVGYYT